MRLAFFTDSYYAASRITGEACATPDGPSAAVQGLAHGLGRNGHTISILAHGRHRTDFTEGPVSVQVFRRPAPSLPFRVSRHLVRHLRDMSHRIDALVINGMFQPRMLPVAIAAHRAGMPYIIASHGCYHPAMLANNPRRKTIYWSLIERWMLQQSAAIQVLSSTHERHLRALGITRPVITVPNGTDPGTRPPPPAAHREQSAPPRLGYLGRIDIWTKGLDILLEGFARAGERAPDLELIIQGPDRGDVATLRQQAARLRIEDRVQFRPPEPVPAVETIAGWDALIAPSRFDGFPLTVVEAMLAQRPVICSAEAGAIEHVHRAGCGFEVTPCPDSIADGIRQWLDRREHWPAMGASGYRYATTCLSWDTIARDAADAYAAIVGTS